MKKTDWKYIVVTLIFMCIMGMVIIGFLRGLIISKDFTASENVKHFLNLRCHYWGNIHFYLSIAFTVLSTIYIILSWRWIKDKGLQLFRRGWAMMIILITVIFFLVFLLLWASSPKAPDEYEVYEGKVDSNFITDQMTLLDVEKATGIPARKIADALGLPSKILLNGTLKQIGKKYGITLQEMKNVVNELINKKISLTYEQKEEEKQIKKEQETKEELRYKERLPKKPEHRLVRGRMAAVPSGILITGKMSLYDLEEITGIPARNIADELGIPSNTSFYEQLGRLRKKYLFSMQEVRDVVASLMEKNINKKTKNGSQKSNES